MLQHLPSDRPPLPALTSARFIAALYVVLAHFLVPTLKTAPDWVVSALLFAQPAVSFFFILSGFVLTYSQTGRDGDLRGSRKAFWLSRFARIYPVYLLAIVLTLPALYPLLVANIDLWAEGVMSVFALQSWVPIFIFHFNGPGWSISVEAFFYINFTRLCLPVFRLSTRSAVLLLVALYALAVIPRAIFASVAFPGPDEPFGLADLGMNFWTSVPLLRLPEFLAGMVAARLVGNRAADPVRHFRGMVPNALMIGVIGGLILVEVMLMPSPFRYVMNWIVSPLLVGLVAILAVSDTFVGRILSHPIPVVFGTISYSFYILQVPVFILLSLFFAYFPWYVWRFATTPLGEQVWFFLLFLVALTIASFISYFWFERPVRRWIYHLALRSVPQAPAKVVPEIAAR